MAGLPDGIGALDDPLLIDLGRALGLLDSQHAINTAWFNDPLTAIRNAGRQPDTLLALFEHLTAAPDDFRGKHWYPIQAPATGNTAASHTGLFVVHHQMEKDVNMLGVGVKRAIVLGSDVDLVPYVYLPLVQVETGTFLPDPDKTPLEVGIVIDGVIQHGHAAVRGLGFDLKVFFANTPPVFDIDLVKLTLPASVDLPGVPTVHDPGGADVSLITLAKDAPDRAVEWTDFALAFLTDQLASLVADPAEQDIIRAISEDVRVICGLAPHGPLSATTDFSTWFRSIAASPEKLTAWLQALACLFHAERLPSSGNPTGFRGVGTAADPFVIDLSSPGTHDIAIALQLRVDRTQDAVRLTPGLELSSRVLTPASAAGIQVRANVQLATVNVPPADRLDRAIAAEATPSCVFRVVFCNPERPDEGRLFTYVDAGTPANSIALDRVEARLSWDGGATAPSPSFTFVGLTPHEEDTIDYGVEEIKADGGRRLVQLANALLAVHAASAAVDAAIDPPPLPWPQDGEPDSLPPYPIITQLEGSPTRRRNLDFGDALLRVLKPLAGLQPATDANAIAERLQSLASALSSMDMDAVPARMLTAVIDLFKSGALIDAFAGSRAVTADESGGLLTFQAGESLSIDVGVRGTPPLFGVWMTPVHDITSVQVQLRAGLGVSIVNTASVGLDVEARARIAPALLNRLSMPSLDSGPELAASYRRFDGTNTFSLDLFPAGAGPLQLTLAPEPRFCDRASPATAIGADRWFLRLATEVALPIAADAILNLDVVRRPLSAAFLRPLDRASTLSGGMLLEACGVLNETGFAGAVRYRLADAGMLASLKPGPMLANAFECLLEHVDELAVFTVARGVPRPGVRPDGIFLVKEAGAFGLRVKLSDVPLGSPKLQLQLGQWLPGETDQNNWLTRAGGAPAASGITLQLVTVKDGVAAFSGRLTMTSVGLDYRGDPHKPLVDIHGYQLGGIQPRLYLAADGSSVKAGGAVRLDAIGIPLGPRFGSSGGENPVAQNMLSSSGGDEGAATDAVNPTFSAVVAGVEKFYGAILADPPSDDNVIWVRVDKSFGPLYCRTIGLGFANDGTPAARYPKLSVGYDGRVVLGPLDIDLAGFEVGIPLKSPDDFGAYSLKLGGLNISFRGGPVEISGGLLKSGEGPETEYTGVVVVKAQAFSVSGMGSYALADGNPSFFVYALLHKDLGGPCWFHVKGLALGFGYNRDLIVPPIEGVADFPLMRAAREPNYLTAGDPHAAVELVKSYIPPARGAYWLAAGVQFTSFEMIQSFALLTVAFGHGFEVNLLGFSQISVPTGAASPIAYAEIALKATFRPSEGLLAVRGELTRASYVLSRDCHLTGGFAFYSWFSGEHEGDFVLTLGGYHPRFAAPAHYPTVSDRLGINWSIGSHLTIKGGEYFALTPSALMAGGSLEALWTMGDLSASFALEANFLLNWKPFHYEADARISIGVSYRLNLLFTSTTVSAHFGVGVHLWGPPFGGEAHVDWTIISFTISFGAGKPARPERIPWTAKGAAGFKESFLPKTARETAGVLTAQDSAFAWQVSGTRVVAGLIVDLTQQTSYTGPITWVINSEQFRIETRSMIPSKRVSFNTDLALADAEDYVALTRTKAMCLPADPAHPERRWETGFGIGPVGLASGRFTSDHEIAIRKYDPTKGELDDDTAFDDCGDFTLTPVLKSSPQSLWGPAADRKTQLSGDSRVIPWTLSGFSIAPAASQPAGALCMPLRESMYAVSQDQRCLWDNPKPVFPGPYRPTGDWQAVMRATASSDTSTKIAGSLATAGFIDDLATRSTTIDVDSFLQPPVLRHLGEDV